MLPSALAMLERHLRAVDHVSICWLSQCCPVERLNLQFILRRRMPCQSALHLSARPTTQIGIQVCSFFTAATRSDLPRGLIKVTSMPNCQIYPKNVIRRYQKFFALLVKWKLSISTVSTSRVNFTTQEPLTLALCCSTSANHVCFLEENIACMFCR